MTIIEKEIAKRKTLIDECGEKALRAQELRAEADILEKEASAIDIDTLAAEVAELEEFLPKTCEEVTEEVAEAAEEVAPEEEIPENPAAFETADATPIVVV